MPILHHSKAGWISETILQSKNTPKMGKLLQWFLILFWCRHWIQCAIHYME